MSKTVTLRLSDEEFQHFSKAAEAVQRPLSNLIRYLARQKLEENLFVDQIEMEEILNNQQLLNGLKQGSDDARQMKGTFVDV